MNGCIRTDFQFCVATVAAVLALPLLACSSGKTKKDVVHDADSATDVGGPETVVFPDVKADGVQDVRATETAIVDLQGEMPGPACAPGEGCFLDKCTENSQCQSGWCVEHLGEGVCSQVCQDECPAGWSCKQVAGTDPDVVFICVSKFANLCRPCSSGADCKSVGGVDDVCVDYGPDGDFCGGACAENDDCPWGFSCKDGKTVEGADVKQCVAETGTCPCTAKSVALAATTTCEVVNEFGECPGTRTCTEEGLTSCTAAEPVQESCNGIDDDCDDDLDEPALAEGKLLELCDDGNDCTEDSCAGQGGCKNTTLDSGSCDDANSCTIADHCVQGTCIGTPVECHDDNPCTDDVCTETGGCEFPVNAAPCDDGNPCTLGDQCIEGVCKGTEMPCECQVDADCGVLEDGDLCNGSLACDTGSLPYKCVVDPATVMECPEPEGENAFCLKGTCEPGTGLCSFVPNHEGFLCDNGNACTVNDKCIAGVCAGGVGVNCNDGNPCTNDECVPESGCTHEANTAPCTDGDACTVGDHCADGACVPGEKDDCDDNDMCNGVEICDVVKGCVSGTQLTCDDGEACNGIETCDPVLGCLPGMPIVCDDFNPCTTDFCVGGVCTFESLAGACDDGNACTSGDHCDGGNCIYDGIVDCSDGNVCTKVFCDPKKGCSAVANDAPCDDGNVCTTGDQCHLGECIGSDLLACNDGNPCTDDSCSPQVGCQFAPNVGDCDDGNACTANDKCAGGWCLAGAMLDCDDGNECTDDQCAPGAGCVHGPVDDGTSCIGGEAWSCKQGLCICQPKTCEALGMECAVWPNGCGGETVDCGQCGPDEVCDAGGKCGCKTVGCGSCCCPSLDGYDVTCNAQQHCEYANPDNTGWKKWDVWIWIAPGAFQMGSPVNEVGQEPDESPVHAVTFAEGYFVGKYEVVVAQYEACKAAIPGKCTAAATTDWDGNGWGTNTSANGRSEHPQNGLTWQQARDFCAWVAPSGGRLASEAEWEYAATGPVHLKYPWGSTPEPSCTNNTAVLNEAGGSGGYGCSQGGTWKVGAKTAGPAWSGALDMSGNLAEWNEDWYHYTYSGAPNDGTPWVAPTSSYRVLRGSSFAHDAAHMRSSRRGGYMPGFRSANFGTRCVRPLVCTPDCAFRECGNDGCGGSCGGCPQGEECNAQGQCAGWGGVVWKPVPGGTYQMGCSPGDGDCFDSEKPAHSVTLSPFEILETEVTEIQYVGVIGENPSCDYMALSGPDSPIECVNWYEAKAFCEAVGGRLCTEAEWEYAARGGTTTRYYCGDDASCLDGIAWYNHYDFEHHKHDVREKAPNAYELYDMLGNVWEWTADWYGSDYYGVSPADNPTGPNSGKFRVFRGGSFYYAQWLTVSVRFGDVPSDHALDVGFRCCRSIQP